MNEQHYEAERLIPDIVIRRLPIYARSLRHLLHSGIATVSSDELAERIGVTAAQIRRDLSYFGRFGKQGKGYDVATLIDEIHGILNLDRRWDIALVGFGHLGRAIADYPGFAASSFRIVAIFDRSPDLIGAKNAFGVPVQPQTELVSTVQKLGIKVGIVAVPAATAQDVANDLIAGGVGAILNYAPVTLRVPDEIRVRDIDPISALQSMTYYLDNNKTEPDSEWSHAANGS
ncbi:MAG: redox-sensing transcriptional repressor Rex [Chloroflexota bacterium]